MTWYALDDIDDAIETTRAFLLPFDRGRWVRLAIIVLFVGGVGGFNPLQFPGGGGTSSSPSAPGGPGASSTPDPLSALGAPEAVTIAALVGLVGVIVLGFMFVGSVMEFVFVESLRRQRVTIRSYWSEWWRAGLRLFGFRLVLSVITLVLLGAIVVAVLWPLVVGNGGFSVGLLVAGIPVFVLVAVLSGLVNGFTTSFIVPVMLSEERTVLSAWRRFWPTLTGQWKQYAAYVILRFVLQLVASILVGMLLLVGGIVLAIPFVLIGLLGVGLLSVVEVIGWAIIGIAAVLFGLAAVVLALLITVPVTTYLRYYVLLVLGDTNDDFDLIAEQRRAARA